jgi:hypothetical protein
VLPVEPGRETTAPIRPRRVPGGPNAVNGDEERRREQRHPHPGRRKSDWVPADPPHDVDVEA